MSIIENDLSLDIVMVPEPPVVNMAMSIHVNVEATEEVQIAEWVIKKNILLVRDYSTEAQRLEEGSMRTH